jgi:hypothetical protein
LLNKLEAQDYFRDQADKKMDDAMENSSKSTTKEYMDQMKEANDYYQFSKGRLVF